MLICKVTGSVISTRKHDMLKGAKFTIVELAVGGELPFLAVDNIGAGVGELVIVVRGSGARVACGSDEIPADAAIVGIIDDGTY